MEQAAKISLPGDALEMDIAQSYAYLKMSYDRLKHENETLRRDIDKWREALELAEEEVRRMQAEELRRIEEETSKKDGLSGLEPSDKKAQVTIIYGDLTLRIEGPISGLANTLIHKLSE